MTIKELLDIAPQIVSIDLDIRNNGRYNYKYVVGEHIQLHDGYIKANSYRHYELEKGEQLNFDKVQFPATFWAIDPRKLDHKVLDLVITDMRLWRPSKSWLYGKPKGWESVEAVITCDIGDKEFNGVCTKKIEQPKSMEIDIDRDQMSITDFIGG